jgi:uncharacterized membrane protein
MTEKDPNIPEKIDSKEDRSLEKPTRAILLIGIIIVSSFIIYDLTRPKEKFVLFSVLNQDKQLGNYTSELKVNESIAFFFYVENHLQQGTDFSVRIYLGNEYSKIIPKTGVYNGTSIANYTTTSKLENNANWTSSQIIYKFTQSGIQFIGLELWKKTDNNWQYCENYTLFLRVNVTTA